MKPAKPYNSQRGIFAWLLYDALMANPNAHLLTADLGFGMWDAIRDDFPDQFTNTGATEQATMDVAVGMTLAGKTVFVYSITPFLVFRPFETLRTYVDHESIPVKLVGGGRNNDYKEDGFSHSALDVKYYLNGLDNIQQFWPKTMQVDEIRGCLRRMLESDKPCFISLKR